MVISSNKTTFYDRYRIIGEHVTDYVFPPHMHSECEYLYMVKGECVLFANFEKIILKKGEAFFLVPWMLHSIEGQENSEMYIITFSKDTVSFFDRCINADNCISMPYVPSQTVNETVFGELADRKCSDILTLCACTNLICGDFIKHNPQTDESRRDNGNAIAGNAVKYMREHYRENITLSHVASQVGTSPSYLSRILNSMNELGFSGYIDELRISHAQMLLRTTDMKISDIAQSSGYGNIRTFNRKFREHFYKSPSDMRREDKTDSVGNRRKRSNDNE